MKKLLLILLLMPTMALAKRYRAQVTMNDASTKEGFIEIPDAKDNNLKFFAEERGGKPEKLKVEDVKGFTFQNDKNLTVEYKTIRLAMPRALNPEKINIDDDKSWTMVIQSGKGLEILSAYSNGGAVFGGQTSNAGYGYYYHWIGQDYALYFYFTSSGGGNFFMGNHAKNIQKSVKFHFRKDCPKLYEKITEEGFNKNGIGWIVTLYDENCGKQK